MKKQNEKSSGHKQSPEPRRQDNLEAKPTRADAAKKSKLLYVPKNRCAQPSIQAGSTGLGKSQLFRSILMADFSRQPDQKREPFIVGYDSEQKNISSSVLVSDLRFQIFKPKPPKLGYSRVRSALATARGELRPGAVVIVIDRKRKEQQ